MTDTPDTPCAHVWQGDGPVAHCAHCEAVLFRPASATPDTSAAPDICRWCGHTRPDHDEVCPVRTFAEGIARTMSSPKGAVTEFGFDISIDQDD